LCAALGCSMCGCVRVSACVCLYVVCACVRECDLTVCEKSYVRFLTKNVPTVDAIGPGKIAYQITLASSHSINEEGLQKAVDVVGATAEEPLRLCVCVDQDAFPVWAKKARVELPGRLAECVRVYVVLIRAAEAARTAY